MKQQPILSVGTIINNGTATIKFAEGNFIIVLTKWGYYQGFYLYWDAKQEMFQIDGSKTPGPNENHFITLEGCKSHFGYTPSTRS